ncbi:O-antigen ligase family protein [Hephaestia sp. GCM10023244]|uniref:O-antigen ligase family protein n=1 Tax=unclassified Hephaestia TaxID=2631281 RepID=UPI0020773281|nr:O-antigen ligase family protein [Hephaestia sp. MAHUQ-44]MCM8731657.1 O-antigen ligase family protein [Hephaestia sp. MAHUQ-44]
MAIVYIVVLTALVLGGLHLFGGRLAVLTGPHQWAAAILLPVVATYGHVYPAFAATAIATIAIAPALGHGGLVLPAPRAIDLRARLMLFCLPLMPIMTKTFAVSGLTILQLNFAGLLAIGFAIALFRDDSHPPATRLARWDMAFVLMMAVQFVIDARGNDLTFSMRAFMQVIVNLGLPYVAISRAFARVQVPNDLLMALLVAGCVIAAIASFESAHSWLLYDNMGAHIGADRELASGYVKQRGGLLRGRASFPESTGLSLLLGLLIVILVALRKQIETRGAFLTMLLLLGCGLFFTLARIGYIAVAVGLVACCIGERRWGALARLVATLPLAAGAIMLLATIVPALAASIGASDDAAGSVDYRSELLSRGLGIVRQYWATGLSLKDLYALLEPLRQGEGIIDLVNQPLTIFMRAGVIGGVLYFVMFAAILVRTFTAIPRLPDEARATAVACFAALVAIIASLTTTSYGRNETTFILLLAMGAGVLSRYPRAATDTRRQPWVPRAPRDWAPSVDQPHIAK